MIRLLGAIAPMIAAVIATLAVDLPACADTPTASPTPMASPDANAIVQALTARMDAVESYQARIHVDIQMQSFPFLATSLDGTATYRRPAQYTVTFDSVPELASAFQKVSGDIGDPAAWPQKYHVTIDPSAAKAPAGQTVLRLTEKVHGQIDHALAFVDENARTITGMNWYYYSGGIITMQQHFAPQGGVLLVDHQTADIHMPGYKASIQAQFNGYSVQVSMTSPAGR
ncbi:MAG TPA: hypothetical protein VEJ20_09335 [Candidatus Eremiobacteraceae bacterium]|nr:hypothetical protein [Candidatus Eremiobacteraceae bacterium]